MIRANCLHGVAFLLWESAPRACRLKASNAAPHFSTNAGTFPRVGGFGFCVTQHRQLRPLSFEAGPLFDAASKFKTAPSVTLSNLTELMQAGRQETENQPSLPKSSYRGPCH
jgi:hypothetical protein